MMGPNLSLLSMLSAPPSQLTESRITGARMGFPGAVVMFCTPYGPAVLERPQLRRSVASKVTSSKSL